MNSSLPFAALAILVGFGVTADAKTLVGGPVFGGNGLVDSQIACRFYNAGTSPVTFSAKVLTTNNSATLTKVFGNCTTLQSQKQCSLVYSFTANAALTCQATVTATLGKPLVSGLVEISTEGGKFIKSAVPMN